MAAINTLKFKLLQAQALYDRKQFREARIAYEEAVNIKPDSPEAAAGLARSLLVEGAYKDAKALYAAAFSRGLPKNGEHLTHLGICYAFEGDQKTARTLMQGAIAVEPSYQPAYEALTAHCLTTGDYLAAERFATEGIRLFPSSASCHESRSKARLSMLKIEAAEADADACLKLQPHSVGGMLCKGGVLIARQQYAEACTILEKARQIDPENEEVLLALGNGFQLLEKDAEAEALYQKARKISPSNWRIYQCLASLELKRGNAGPGLQFVDIALGLQDAPILHLFRGLFLRQAGHLDEARPEFKKAVEGNPLDVLSWVNLAELESEEQKPGQQALAKEHAGKVLEISPSGALGDRARAVLERLKI